MRAKLPDERRVRRAQRQPHPLRGLRPGPADHGVPAALEHRPFARLQGADPVFQRTLPLHRLRRAGQRPERPAGRHGGLFAEQLRGRRACRHGRDRRRRGHPGRPVVRRPARLLPRGLSSRARQGCDPCGRGGSCRAEPQPHDAQALPGAAARHSRAGTSTIAPTGSANYPDFAEHFVKNIFSEPHSTKQIEDGIGLGQRYQRPGAGEDRRSPRHHARVRRHRGDVPPHPLPRAGDPRRRRPDPALRPRQAHRRADWRRASDHRRAAATIRSAAIPPSAMPRSTTSSIAGSGIAAPKPMPRRAARRSARSISPRPSASATAGATSPSRRNCASSIPACKSTGWRRTR